MSDEARDVDDGRDNLPDRYDRADLVRAGIALVQLDAWCRREGMAELAALVEAAADWADRALTTSS